MAEAYLGECHKTREEVSGTHQFERIAPGWFGTGPLRVGDHRFQSALEQNQHAVHDTHDEMGRLAQFSH